MSGPTESTSDPVVGIIYNAEKCEETLRLADFVKREPTLSGGMETSLRKLAEFYSCHAFRWAQRYGRTA